eukprot:g20220.t1
MGRASVASANPPSPTGKWVPPEDLLAEKFGGDIHVDPGRLEAGSIRRASKTGIETVAQDLLVPVEDGRQTVQIEVKELFGDKLGVRLRMENLVVSNFDVPEAADVGWRFGDEIVAVNGKADKNGTQRPDCVMLDPGASAFLSGYGPFRRYLEHLKYDCNFPIEKIAMTQGKRRFQFGGDAASWSTWSAHLPVFLDGRYGTVQLFLLPGNTPMLCGCPIIEALGMTMDFAMKRIRIELAALPGKRPPLADKEKTNSSGCWQKDNQRPQRGWKGKGAEETCDQHKCLAV